VSDSPLTEYCLEKVKANGWEVFLWFGLAAIGVGYALGWVVTVIKKNAQIAQIREDARRTSGENIEKLAQMRDAANSKHQILDMAQQNMRDALLASKGGANNVDKLRSCRDEMCSIYASEYLPALTNYLELIPRLVDRKEAMIRAQTELIPGLDTICRFLDMVNMSEMLAKIPGSQPYKLQRARRDGLFVRVETLVPLWRIDLRWKVQTIRKRTDKYLRN
jgi:hypothetical protein